MNNPRIAILEQCPQKQLQGRARAQHTVWIHRFNAVSYSNSCPSSVSKINLSSSFENEMRGSLSNSVGSCGKLLVGALPSSGFWSVISCSQGGLELYIEVFLFVSGEYFSLVRLCRDCRDMLERNRFSFAGWDQKLSGNPVTMAGAPAVDCDWLRVLTVYFLWENKVKLGLVWLAIDSFSLEMVD